MMRYGEVPAHHDVRGFFIDRKKSWIDPAKKVGARSRARRPKGKSCYGLFLLRVYQMKDFIDLLGDSLITIFL